MVLKYIGIYDRVEFKDPTLSYSTAIGLACGSVNSVPQKNLTTQPAKKPPHVITKEGLLTGGCVCLRVDEEPAIGLILAVGGSMRGFGTCCELVEGFGWSIDRCN